VSGGHYNYSYRHVADMAQELEECTDPVRKRFAQHLRLVADAMHDVEWVDSCDYGLEGDHAAILKVIGEGKTAELTEVLCRLRMSSNELRTLLRDVDVDPDTVAMKMKMRLANVRAILCDPRPDEPHTADNCYCRVCKAVRACDGEYV
jgi:hypothetical protein